MPFFVEGISSTYGHFVALGLAGSGGGAATWASARVDEQSRIATIPRKGFTIALLDFRIFSADGAGSPQGAASRPGGNFLFGEARGVSTSQLSYLATALAEENADRNADFFPKSGHTERSRMEIPH